MQRAFYRSELPSFSILFPLSKDALPYHCYFGNACTTDTDGAMDGDALTIASPVCASGGGNRTAMRLYSQSP